MQKISTPNGNDQMCHEYTNFFIRAFVVFKIILIMVILRDFNL